VAGHLLRESRHRSDIVKYLQQVRDDYGLDGSAVREHERTDIDTIDAWYSMGRHVAFGRQYQADVASSFQPDEPVTGQIDLALEQIRSRDRTPDLVVPDEIFQGLAVMSPEDFGRFTYESRERLRAVWHHGGIKQLQMLLDDLERRIGAQEPTTKRLQLVSAIGIVAGALAAPAAAFAGAGGIVVASIVSATFGAIAAGETVPQLVRLHNSRRQIKRAIHYLHRRHHDVTTDRPPQ
jgi:hypothetical protein